MEKSIIDNILEKAVNKSRSDTYDYPFPDRLSTSSADGKDYTYNPKRQELSVSTFENGSQKRLDKRVLATTKENEKKLKNASLSTTIDAILEKAVYGAGASGGKFQRGSGKDESKPGAVKKPELTEEQKKKIISSAQTRSASQAERTGLHATAARIRAEKSLDERTCDLVKDLTKERGKEIHDAVMTARMIKEDLPEASNMKVKPEDLTRVVRTHNNIAAARTQKSICDKWQTGSAFITKGARVMPLGPGGEVSTLSKDEEQKPKSFIGSIPGARSTKTSTEPSHNDVESKMNEIQEGKRSKRAAKIKDAFGAE